LLFKQYHALDNKNKQKQNLNACYELSQFLFRSILKIGEWLERLERLEGRLERLEKTI